MPSPGLIRQYRFFREHAGYVDGESAAGALRLARAEREASARGWYVEWIEDDIPCGHDPKCEGAPLVAVLKSGTTTLGCLGGICGATDEYRRVIEAEFAQEALYDVKREECAALGTDE